MKHHFYTAPAVFITIVIILLGVLSVSPQSAVLASEHQAPKITQAIDGQPEVLFSAESQQNVCSATPSDGTFSSLLEGKVTGLQENTKAPLASICCFRYLIGCDCCYCYYDMVCFYC